MAKEDRCSRCGRSGWGKNPVRKIRGSKERLCGKCRFDYKKEGILLEFFANRNFRMLMSFFMAHGVRLRPYIQQYPFGQLSLSDTLFYANNHLCKLCILDTPFSSRGSLFWRGKVISHDRAEFRVIRLGDGKRYPFAYCIVPVEELVLGHAFYIPIRRTRVSQQRCLPREQTLLRYMNRFDLLKHKLVRVAS